MMWQNTSELSDLSLPFSLHGCAIKNHNSLPEPQDKVDRMKQIAHFAVAVK